MKLKLFVYTKTDAFVVLGVLSLQEAAVNVLTTESLDEKASASFQYVDMWNKEIIQSIYPTDGKSLTVPSKPARPVNTGGHSDKSSWAKVSPVVNALHGIAHAESWAMDLFWDCIARYARGFDMPWDFFDELVEVAGQEAKHFCDWRDRLQRYDCPYGTLPTHDGLWRSAEETAHDLTARLGIVNLVYEARGLDTYPLTLKKLEKAGDTDSIQILNRNYLEEIQHVEKGVRWFTYKCNQIRLDPQETFHAHVKQYHAGPLKGPFNTAARNEANMPIEWYQPLTSSK